MTGPRIALYSFVLICFTILLLSNAGSDKFKLWDPANKLTWKDFRDTVLEHSDRAAMTNSGIRVSFRQSAPTAAIIDAFSTMDPARSWVVTSKKSDYILSHEQYHFNITEYWCRKMKKDFSTTRFTAKNLKEKIASVRAEDMSGWHDMQDQYDHDTRHSEIEAEQRKWEKKIDGLLKSVEEYSAESITVVLH